MYNLKRVLIITYYWPPCGGISIIRPLKLVKYLKGFGWEPIVCTAENPHYPIEDKETLNEINDEIEIIKVPIFEPYNIYKKITGQKKKSDLVDVIQNSANRSYFHKLSIWIRGNIFIPDARCFWIKPVVKKISSYIKNNSVDAIITTGPPHTVNRIGYLLKKLHKIPWIADFQDPWTQVDYYKYFKISSLANRLHKKMERQIFNNADLITIVSNSWKSDLKSIGAKKVEVIPLGYDPDDFKENIKLDNYFTLTHLGLLGIDRNPLILLKAIKNICSKNKDFSTNFRLQLVGKVNDELKTQIDNLQLSKNVIYIDQVSRDKALKIMQSSHLLLLLLNKAKNVSGRVPGKVFEYFGSKRPILSIGPSGTDIESMINNTFSGQNINYDDYKSMCDFLIQNYNQFNSKKTKIFTNKTNIYSHLEITTKFAKYLNKITKK